MQKKCGKGDADEHAYLSGDICRLLRHLSQVHFASMLLSVSYYPLSGSIDGQKQH